MADYLGTDNDDIIDNAKLALARFTVVKAGKGNDRITTSISLQISGGEGNDTIDGGGYSSLLFDNPPNGISVDLQTGIVLDGTGGTDSVKGIWEVFGTNRDDVILGNEVANQFWTGWGGTDRFDGKGGNDILIVNAAKKDVQFSRNSDGSWSYSGRTDTGVALSGTFSNIEIVQFYDGSKSPFYILGDAGLTEVLPDKGPVKLFTGRTIATEFFQADNVGFFVNTISETHPAYNYPNPTDYNPAGFLSITAKNMVAGDFNGDGKLDVSVSWAVSPYMVPRQTKIYPTVFLNDGKGGFGPANSVFVGDIPTIFTLYRSVASDFNGDGVDDLVITGEGNKHLEVGGTPYSGDFGKTPILLFLSNGKGQLENAVAKIQGQEVAGGVPTGFVFGHDLSHGDVDGDGDLDLFTGGVLLLNDGKGNFANGSTLIPSAAKVADLKPLTTAIGDFDGDGLGDILINYPEGNPSYLLLSDGSKTIGKKILTMPLGPFGTNTKFNNVKLADIDGDGDLDIVNSTTRANPFYSGRYLQILINDGRGNFADQSKDRIDNSPFDKAPGEGDLYTQDVNGDGWADIVHSAVSDSDDPGMAIYLNDRTGKFTLVNNSAFATVSSTDIAGYGWSGLGAADQIQYGLPISINAEGKTDFVTSVRLQDIYMSDGQSPDRVALYVMRALKPLGRGINEALIGSVNNDLIWGFDGNDAINGSAGYDTAAFADLYADVSIKLAGNSITVTTKTEGVDTLTNIEALRFADQTVTVAALKRDLAPASFSLVTDTGFAGSIGSSGRVVGTTGAQDITVGNRIGNVSFDPSFNSGGDIIRLPGKAADWTIQRTGSSAKLVSETVSATIPIGTTANWIVFSDGARSLLYKDGSFKIGSQSFAESAQKITAASDGNAPSLSLNVEASGRLILSAGADVSVGGKVQVIGTSGGKELVEVLNGKVSFDPSFNGGGDVIDLPGNASAWSAVRSGSSMLLTKGNDSAVIPIGTTGTDLAFDNATRALLFANGQFKIGSQMIEGSTPTTLMG